MFTLWSIHSRILINVPMECFAYKSSICYPKALLRNMSMCSNIELSILEFPSTFHRNELMCSDFELYASVVFKWITRRSAGTHRLSIFYFLPTRRSSGSSQCVQTLSYTPQWFLNETQGVPLERCGYHLSIFYPQNVPPERINVFRLWIICFSGFQTDHKAFRWNAAFIASPFSTHKTFLWNVSKCSRYELSIVELSSTFLRNTSNMLHFKLSVVEFWSTFPWNVSKCSSYALSIVEFPPTFQRNVLWVAKTFVGERAFQRNALCSTEAE
jgi:hypothetical protein